MLYPRALPATLSRLAYSSLSSSQRMPCPRPDPAPVQTPARPSIHQLQMRLHGEGRQQAATTEAEVCFDTNIYPTLPAASHPVICLRPPSSRPLIPSPSTNERHAHRPSCSPSLTHSNKPVQVQLQQLQPRLRSRSAHSLYTAGQGDAAYHPLTPPSSDLITGSPSRKTTPALHTHPASASTAHSPARPPSHHPPTTAAPVVGWQGRRRGRARGS